MGSCCSCWPEVAMSPVGSYDTAHDKFPAAPLFRWCCAAAPGCCAPRPPSGPVPLALPKRVLCQPTSSNSPLLLPTLPPRAVLPDLHERGCDRHHQARCAGQVQRDPAWRVPRVYERPVRAGVGGTEPQHTQGGIVGLRWDVWLHGGRERRACRRLDQRVAYTRCGNGVADTCRRWGGAVSCSVWEGVVGSELQGKVGQVGERACSWA